MKKITFPQPSCLPWKGSLDMITVYQESLSSWGGFLHQATLLDFLLSGKKNTPQYMEHVA